MRPTRSCSDQACTLPKLRLEGFETSVPEAVATAVTGTFTAAVESSVVTTMLPLALPAACGVNVTEKLLRWPAPKVRGKLMPLIRKPLPVTVAWRMVRSALPELIRVADWVMLAPIFTLPRARLVGETASCPPPIPVPVTER